MGRSLVRSQPVSLEFLIDKKSFQSHYGPGVDSTSNRNEYQQHFLGGKGGRCVRLTTLPPSWAVVMKSGNLNFLEPSGPLQACNGTVLPFLWHTHNATGNMWMIFFSNLFHWVQTRIYSKLHHAVSWNKLLFVCFENIFIYAFQPPLRNPFYSIYWPCPSQHTIHFCHNSHLLRYWFCLLKLLDNSVNL